MDATTPNARKTSSAAETILRVTSGNFLEMFDFFLLGFFAEPIGKAFFPVEDEAARLLLVFLTFGARFLMRPLGAIVLGAYVDEVGRRKGLIVTLGIMALGTVAIALTPSYATLHDISPTLALLAPAAVLLGGLAQGFSAGVELGGVSVYLAEMAPPGRRGFYASWQSASQQVATIAAALVGLALSRGLTPSEVSAWGWRVPFVLGCLIVPLIFVLRRQLEETEDFSKRKHHPTARQVFATLNANWPIVTLGTLLVVMTTVSFYILTIYTPTFGREVLQLKRSDTLLVSMAIGAANFCWLPIFGALSDKIGRKPILLTFAILMIATAYPALCWLAAAPSFGKMLAVALWLSFLYAGYNGAMVVALTEVVPPDVRTSGFSLAYSLATAIFGGFTPAISQELIKLTADKAAPGIWMTAAAALSLVATLLIYRGTANETA